ncbi:MAG TPA: hypothetical protein VIX63_01935 [Vicinamibacterales bacterium]
MRPSPLLTTAVVLALIGPAFAQGEWDVFASTEDGFSVNFPGQPKVEQTTWMTQYRYALPARIYRANNGQERYSVTVVDYRGLEQQGIERSKQCPPGAEPCRGNQVGGVIGPGYWKMDVRGAMTFASLKFIQRDAKVTDLNWQFQELVEGLHLQLTNPDQSRTFAYITMHDNRLYIFEGTTPKGSPEPALFQGSVGFVDKDGNGIRYQTIYSNAYHGLGEYPLPNRAGRGGGGGPAGGAGGGQGAGGRGNQN